MHSDVVRRKQASRRSFGLGLEVLEQRLAPATLYWDVTFLSQTNDWSEATNWWKYTQNPFGEGGTFFPAGKKPDTEDDVVFVGGNANDDCVVNEAASVKSITFNEPGVRHGGYTANITLQASLELRGGVSLLNSNATIRGPEGQRGSFTVYDLPGMPNATELTWRAGAFQNVNIEVRPGAAVEVKGGFSEAVRSMTDTHIRVFGTAPTPLFAGDPGRLTWNGGNVAVAGSSEIYIEQHGLFQIQPENATWGTDVSSLSVAVSGAVSANPTGTATIKGNFTNYGTTTVSRGTLDLAGRAEQGGANSEFALANRATVKVSSSDRLLGIRNGRITGDGFVDGNLSLGNDPQAAGYSTLPPVSPVIAPGTESTMGTITVKLSFQMFKGRMEIDVIGPNANQYDRVEVTGYAAVTDTIVGRFDAAHVLFPQGTKIPFLHANGNILGRFPNGDITRPWVRDKNETDYWFERDGVVRGRVGGDGNQNGVFEPGLGETVLAGVGVDLLDADGDFLAHTTTGGDGRYLFEQTGYGYFQVRVDRPADTRPSLPHAGSDPAADSDIGVLTCIAGVSVSESDPSSEPDGDALFRPLTANADAVTTAFQTPVGGNVLTNDPAADGDILRAA